MEKNKVLIVVRISLGLVCWFLIYKLYGAFVDPMLAGVLPETVRMILASMVVPYTLGIGAFYLVIKGIPSGSFQSGNDGSALNPGPATIAKYFVIQTGLSFPVMFILNAILTVAGVKLHSMTAEDLLGHVWFYIVLLLIFNPVFEELLFRKLILYRLSALGEKGAIIVSAVLFSLPHIYSQGIPQMFFTFAVGLVWAYVTVKTGKLWPAIVLHALSNLYCAYLPILITMINPALSILFVAVTLFAMVPLTIVFMVKKRSI